MIIEIQTIHNSSHTNVQTPQDDISLSNNSNREKLSYLCFKWDFCVQVRSEIVWWKETIMVDRQRSRSMFCVLRPGHRKWPPRRYIFTKGDTCNRPAPADQISRQNFLTKSFGHCEAETLSGLTKIYLCYHFGRMLGERGA